MIAPISQLGSLRNRRDQGVAPRAARYRTSKPVDTPALRREGTTEMLDNLTGYLKSQTAP
jgi:hypothetical protein